MAFAFEQLRRLELLHLEAAASEDALAAWLQRVTNNKYPWAESDTSKQLRRVLRVWRYMKKERRSGKLHDIHLEIPSRQKDHLLVLCQACPEPGFNLEPDWETIPEEFKHLNSLQLTEDGNFKICMTESPMNDPEDINLIGDKGLQPLPDEFAKYKSTVLHRPPPKPATGKPRKRKKDIEDDEGNADEKVPCNNHKAVNSQHKRNIDCVYTGVAQCQCSHVFIKATADFALGEDFGTTDWVHAQGLRRSGLKTSKPEDPRPHIVHCYDCNCSYCVHVDYRFQHDDLVDMWEHVVSEVETIGALHVYAHVDDCKYIYGPFYKEGVGHFHGETSEHFWAWINKYAPQIFHMNIHHGHETYFYVAMDWCWKKYINMPNQLFKDTKYARMQHLHFRQEHEAETAKHPEEATKWGFADRKTKITRNKGKTRQVESVYKHRQAQVPSLDSVMEELLDNPIKLSSLGGQSSSDVYVFMKDGMVLETRARHLRMLIMKNKKYPSQTDEITISSQREALRMEFGPWLKSRKKIFGNKIQPAKDLFSTPKTRRDKGAYKYVPTGQCEDWALCLPSTMKPMDRERFQHLVEIEVQMREGMAFDALRSVLLMAEALRAVGADKVKNVDRTRAEKAALNKIRRMKHQRNLCISDFNSHREALIRLGALDATALKGLPHMTKEDTYVAKSVDDSRVPGDSRVRSGNAFLWNRGYALAAMGKGFAERSTREKRLESIEEDPTEARGREKRKRNLPVTRRPHEGSEDEDSSDDEEPTGPVKRPKLKDRPERAKVKKAPAKKAAAKKAAAKKAAANTPKASTSKLKIDDVDGENEKASKGHEGWIYDLAERGNMEAADLLEWKLEGDKVQWYRTEAEMDRWQEDHETKQAKFLRSLRSYEEDRRAWTARTDAIAKDGTDDLATKGKIAYGRERIALFNSMIQRTERRMRVAGYGHIMHFRTAKELYTHLKDVRLGKSPMVVKSD
ncbi:hypothetical protein BDZ89DRAFT_1137177 [Hymenopellis radicata]|nr:hypothetical protein BDZ89DRAFT_1137177 [Hymenopellis radicata]